METLEIALDENGNKVVVLPDIIFSNKLIFALPVV